jgi:hypothetical protein
VQPKSSVSKYVFHAGSYNICSYPEVTPIHKQVYRSQKVVCENYSIITAIYILIHVFSKNTQIPPFTKIRLVGAELFLADDQTDMTS